MKLPSAPKLILAVAAANVAVGLLATWTTARAVAIVHGADVAVIEAKRALDDASEAEGLCFASDVRSYCCPSACAVKARRMPSDGDAVLRACWSSLGCRGSAPSSVAMFCDCSRLR